MLARAAERLDGRSADTAFVQADLFDLPFAPGQFATVACHGLLHLFDDVAGALRALADQVATGGSLRVISLVAETAIGSGVLARLHAAGTVAAPRRERDVVSAARRADRLRPVPPRGLDAVPHGPDVDPAPGRRAHGPRLPGPLQGDPAGRGQRRGNAVAEHTGPTWSDQAGTSELARGELITAR